VLIAAFVVAQTCQKDQIRISKEAAIATAKRQIEFEPTRTQIRLLRQGINSKPTWIVSLSIPQPGEPINTQLFKELAVVRVDANTGKVIDVKVQR
jgi:peptidase YpeB-like protein